ncbi:uncharacterized protein LODBEIA_P23790 [Lodderomyces beijingensis]|uniref:Tubulin-folding cofactor D ARM repeats domain-containing protein n=1 Tax=Lodderomyces beijingensis TaxID=1775926 RepID=A0ABP0ZJ44_9ASCO
MDELQDVQVFKNNDRLQAELASLIEQLKVTQKSENLSDDDKRIIFQSVATKIDGIINQYEPQPQLLEKRLTSHLTPLQGLFLTSAVAEEHVGSIIYTFAKICGFKVVILHFPTDTSLVDTLIEKCQRSSKDSTKFACLLWMCNLVLIPFPLNSISSTLGARMLAQAMENLKKYTNCSKVQVVSSIFVSRLLTRPDCQDMLESYLRETETNWFETDSNAKLGHLLVINKLLKRTDLIDAYLQSLLDCITGDILSSLPSLNTVYVTKILSKLATTCIRRHDYEMGSRIINLIFNNILLGDVVTLDTNSRYAVAKALTGIVGQLATVAVNYQNQLVSFVISAIDSELDSDMEMENVNIPKTQILLLSLGFMALQKKLPQIYKEECLAIARRFLFFKVRKGTFVIGTQLRDAACFLIWAILRNLRNLKTCPPVMKFVFTDLIKVLVFDSELLLKRCSREVILEILGRLGNQLVPIQDAHARGEFIVRFVEKLGDLHLNQKVCYEFMDIFHSVFDLSFFIEPLVESICEEDDNGDGSYLNMLLEQTNPKISFIPKCDEIPLSLIEEKLINAKRLHIFHAVTKLRGRVDEIFQNFRLNSTSVTTNSDAIKGYLIYLSSQQQQLTKSQWQPILRIRENTALVNEIRAVLSAQQTIPLKEIIDELGKNQVLSKTIFDFKHFTHEQFYAIVDVIKNPSVHATIRANLIENLSENYTSRYDIAELLDLFDDYTTTEQGDVGSKIRINMIKLVSRINLMSHEIKLKLIRLSGELMDRIRRLAFQTLTGKQFTWTAWFEYYQTLPKHDDGDEVMRLEAWRGLVFAAGSTVGDTRVINEAFKELLQYGPTASDFRLLMALLAKPTNGRAVGWGSRALKGVQVTLQLVLKFFEANYHFEELNYKDLYVKTYNWHINTSNLARVKTVLQIFYHISIRSPELKRRIYDRFLWIICNRKDDIRVFVGEVILFNVVNDLGAEDLFARYEQIDWFDPGSEVQEFVKQVLK